MPVIYSVYFIKEHNFSGNYEYVMLGSYIMENQRELKESNILRKIKGVRHIKPTLDEWLLKMKDSSINRAAYYNTYRTRTELWEINSLTKGRYRNMQPPGKLISEMSI